MPSEEEMLPKSKLEAPSCVLGGGQVALLSESRWAHAPLQTILHKSITPSLPEGQEMEHQGAPPVGQPVPGRSPQLLV